MGIFVYITYTYTYIHFISTVYFIYLYKLTSLYAYST